MENFITYHKTVNFDKLDKLILSLEKRADNGTLTQTMLNKYERELQVFVDEMVSTDAASTTSTGLFKPFEFGALVYLAKGDRALAEDFMRKGLAQLRPGEDWVSESARQWDRQAILMNAYTQVKENEEKINENPFIGFYGLTLIVGVLASGYDLFVSLPRLNTALALASENAFYSDIVAYRNWSVIFDIFIVISFSTIFYTIVQRKRWIKQLSITVMLITFVGAASLATDLTDMAESAGLGSDISQGTLPLFVLAGIFWACFWVFSRKTRALFRY